MCGGLGGGRYSILGIVVGGYRCKFRLSGWRCYSWWGWWCIPRVLVAVSVVVVVLGHMGKGFGDVVFSLATFS